MSPRIAGRRGLPDAPRVVVKVGSSSLTTADGGIADARLDGLVEVLAQRRLADELRQAAGPQRRLLRLLGR